MLILAQRWGKSESSTRMFPRTESWGGKNSERKEREIPSSRKGEGGGGERTSVRVNARGNPSSQGRK